MLTVAIWRSRSAIPDPTPEPDTDLEQTKLEMCAVAAVARLDAALNMYRSNRMLSQATLADALLDIRYRLVQGLPGGDPNA